MDNEKFIKSFGLYGIYYLSNLFQTAKDFSDFVIYSSEQEIKDCLINNTKWK